MPQGMRTKRNSGRRGIAVVQEVIESARLARIASADAK